MDLIMEQLQDFCDCLPDMEDGFFERNVSELINLISILTCWTQEPCETFLNSQRIETLELEDYDPCSCDGGIVEFAPYYTPFDPESLEIYIVKQDGVNETVVPMDSSSFAYSATFGVVRIDVREYIKKLSCECTGQSKLLIKYNAGYPMLPECLLQLFCDLLHVIADKNTCDCSACQACERGSDVEIDFGDEVSKDLDYYLNKLIESGYKQQLGLISLCGKSIRGWGVVV